ncbi:MAG: thiamine phosphate synthase [Pseudomonadota bacterium]
MNTPDTPQLYLITPLDFELSRFPGLLAQLLDQHPVACVRLCLATQDEDRISRAADALREVTHARDVALVLSDHLLLVERLGLDGVHLGDASRHVRPARKALGNDRIVGSFCGASKHDGMTAAEAGADYVSFGPTRPTALGDGTFAQEALFSWWSEMIELPVVAEGDLTEARVRALAPHTDFFGIGDEIWCQEDPLAAFDVFARALC